MAENKLKADVDPVALSFFNASYLPDPNFISRQSLRDQICEGIESNQTVILCGEAGTGKTHAAIHSAYDFCTKAREQKEDVFVLWIHARSVHTVIASFHTAALQLGLPVADEPRSNACELVTDWLRDTIRTCARYLIVLDGLESSDMLDKPLQLPAEFLRRSEPTQKYKALRSYLLLNGGDRFHLLITTRSQDLTQSFDARCITVSNLTLDETQSMCVRVMGIATATATATGDALASHLGTNPLVVRMAVGYLKHTGGGVDNYFASIAESRKKIVNASSSTDLPVEFREHAEMPNKPNVLAAVISESFQMLLRNYDQLGEEDLPSALDRLCLGVGLGGQHAPLWDFAESLDCTEALDQSPALTTLLTLAFSHRSQPGVFTMSDIVYQGFWAFAGPFCEPAMSDSLSAVTMLFENKAAGRRGKAHHLLPLTEVALSYSETKLQAQADLLAIRADYYLSLNFYEEAWRDANSVYQINRTIHGDDSNSRPVAASLHRLGQVTNNMGNYEFALQIHQLALDKIEKLTDADDLSLACTTDLAMTLSRLGKHHEAVELYRRAISERKRSCGNDAQVMSYTASLGAELCLLGQLDEALEMQERAYSELVRLSGKESRLTRDALSELIDTLTKQQKWSTAIEKSRCLLESQEIGEGSDAFSTLAIVGSLAHLLYENGDKEQSYKCYRRALDGYTTLVGPDHPQTKLVQHNYNALFHERLVTV